MKRFLLIAIVIFLMAGLTKTEAVSLPGRLGSTVCYVVKIGNCDVYFYMTPEKDLISRQLIQDLGEGMLILDQTDDLPTTATLMRQASNPSGSYEIKIFDEYAVKNQKILEDYFGIKMTGISRDINTYCNWEGLKYHQDRLVTQYDYLNKHEIPIPHYTLIQDLTLIDWKMGKNSMSATVVQDGELGDRFLFCQFPGEVIGTVYAEPAVYLGPDTRPSYPGHVTLPYHSGIPPINVDGSLKSNPFPGKRASTVLRGVVLTSQMDKIRSRTKELFLNRYTSEKCVHGPVKNYDNGIILKSLPAGIFDLDVAYSCKHVDKENVDVLEIPSDNQAQLVQSLANLFNITSSSINKVSVKRLIKKDGGFSRFDLMDLNISSSSEIILINRSKLPESYRYFNIAQDFTDENLPWVQLYLFEPSMAMKVPYEVFQKLSLTPLEDLFYANEREEIMKNQVGSVKKLVTIVDVFIF